MLFDVSTKFDGIRQFISIYLLDYMSWGLFRVYHMIPFYLLLCSWSFWMMSFTGLLIQYTLTQTDKLEFGFTMFPVSPPNRVISGQCTITHLFAYHFQYLYHTPQIERLYFDCVDVSNIENKSLNIHL